ncbi:MAG TPA: hypothetical protein VG295_05715, partial [Solirubrobacteraceae bacterium]|nr:hypothetical protein [Solirubrobacteraceae bacterium]
MAENLMKPAAQVRDLCARLQRSEGTQEGLLDEVLGAAARIQPARLGDELAAIALDNRDECSL